MKDSKLILLLKSFSPDEFKELGNFVNSPYFTKNKKLPEFYKILRIYYPAFDNPKFTQQAIYNKLCPGKTYSEKIIKYLKTEMHKVAKIYLGVIDMRDNIFDTNLHILKQFGKRVLPGEFRKKASELKKIIDESKIRNNDYYLMNYLLKKEERNFYETKKPLGKRTVFFEGIKGEIDEFIVFFVIKMLKYYAVLRNQENHLNYSYNYKLQDEMMAHAKDYLFDSHPIAAIFYLLNMLFKHTENEQIYFELKELVEINHEILEDEDAELIYTELFNYSKIKYMEGTNGWGVENAAIMKLMINRNIYPRENNYMSENSFLNTISIGLREKEFDWVEDFIGKFVNRVAPERRENVYNYTMGMLHYRKKEYQPALESLSKVKTDDFYYYLRVKNHLLKIYYEQNEINGVLRTIDALRHFLTSNKMMPDYVKDRFLYFVNFLQKLIKTKESKDDFKLKKLAEEITSSPEFENKLWLLKIIEEKQAD